MEYASGGELFERICNAGRFSEDEVLNLLTLCVAIFCISWKKVKGLIFCYWWCIRQGFSSSNSFQGSATVMLWYLIRLFLRSFLETREQISEFCLGFLYSKYVIATWNWRTRCSMEARLLAWKFVILGILRYITYDCFHFLRFQHLFFLLLSFFYWHMASTLVGQK